LAFVAAFFSGMACGWCLRDAWRTNNKASA
jgi:hypothetical protein